MELRIRGTQNEKTNFAGTHFSENKIREQSNVNRTFWTKTREHRTYRTRTRTKMSLLSMLSQNRLLQQNQQSMPQLTQPFQVNRIIFCYVLTLSDGLEWPVARITAWCNTPHAARQHIRAHSSFTADHSFKIKFRDRKTEKNKFPRIFI